ncbi:DUF3168 domain-containing protein [Pseudooceanicola sp. MF1-13]|uniref:tail completion protein gp17 n=1 Tax=Pseudooceanicola sp. MF1-13 TaxID=3379095 RepID=UPI003891662E
MHEAVTALMLNHAPLVALVGDRVHWQVLPDGGAVFPYVILQDVGGGQGYYSKGPDGLHRTRLQVDSYADNPLGVLTLQRLIESLLLGYRGTIAETEIQGVFPDGVRDLSPPKGKDDQRLFRRSHDFIIFWRKDQ